MTRQLLLRALARARARPAALIEIDNREASREAVALGMGVGVMSATEFPDSDARTVPLAIDASELRITEYVACLQERRNMRAVGEFFRIAAEFADMPRRHVSRSLIGAPKRSRQA
jgi:DNA-binding transcriptional LysR family regulator